MSRSSIELVVVNSRARAARAGAIDLRVRRAFAAAGSDVRVVLLPPERIEDAVRESVSQGRELVYVGGGDGTLAMAARCLRDTRTSLGVLPLGTRNNFARDLGVPLDLHLASAALVRGRDARVDLAEVNGTAFVNNASIGVYPRAVTRRVRYETTLGMSKITAMAYATLGVLWRHRAERLRVTWEGHQDDVHTSLVFVGNNEYRFSAAGPGWRDRLDGGVLGVVYTGSMGRFRLLWTAFLALLGTSEERLDLEKASTPSLVVHSRRRSVLVAVDGEVCRLRPPLAFRSLPGALRVRIPEVAP